MAEAKGQGWSNPKVSVEIDSVGINVVAEGELVTVSPFPTERTNHNPSADMGDTVFGIPFDSLHSDMTATVVTVYETDASGPVGLWEISNGGKPKLWLNSQSASYEGYPIRYRDNNEKGVVVHTMTYVYSPLDSLYDGHDTLRIGVSDTLTGEKKLCALRYYDTRLTPRQRNTTESALAIRYGAWLHGPYINSEGDTLWDPAGADRLYSFGICGIGRDDTLSLLQTRSVIRNDVLGIAMADSMQDKSHVMMGCDSNDTGTQTVSVGGKNYRRTSRSWKIRSHGTPAQKVLFQIDPKYAGLECMLSVESEAGIQVIPMTDTVEFESGRDYLIGVLLGSEEENPEEKQRQSDHDGQSGEGVSIAVAPNPTTGNYTVMVDLPEEDEIHIRVADANGRTVEEFVTVAVSGEYRHDTSATVSGVYYVTVSAAGLQKTTKLIVTH